MFKSLHHHFQGIYDAHIQMNNYPFLDNKGEYPFSTSASQVMRPGVNSAELKVVYNGHHTVGELESLLREFSFSGFPVVVGPDSMLILGFCPRRDLDLALRNARRTHSHVTTNSKVYFTANVPESAHSDTNAAPLRLRKVMDLAPITVSRVEAGKIDTNSHKNTLILQNITLEFIPIFRSSSTLQWNKSSIFSGSWDFGNCLFVAMDTYLE